MPIPKPKDKEERSEFFDRCMGNETMNKEYPNNSQRMTVCITAWKKRKK